MVLTCTEKVLTRLQSPAFAWKLHANNSVSSFRIPSAISYNPHTLIASRSCAIRETVQGIVTCRSQVCFPDDFLPFFLYFIHLFIVSEFYPRLDQFSSVQLSEKRKEKLFSQLPHRAVVGREFCTASAIESPVFQPAILFFNYITN